METTCAVLHILLHIFFFLQKQEITVYTCIFVKLEMIQI